MFDKTLYYFYAPSLKDNEMKESRNISSKTYYVIKAHRGSRDPRIVSKSFVGMSCYMIFIGIYTTVTYLSRRNMLTNVVLRQLSNDKLFGSFVRSEQGSYQIV